MSRRVRALMEEARHARALAEYVKVKLLRGVSAVRRVRVF